MLWKGRLLLQSIVFISFLSYAILDEKLRKNKLLLQIIILIFFINAILDMILEYKIQFLKSVKWENLINNIINISDILLANSNQKIYYML